MEALSWDEPNVSARTSNDPIRTALKAWFDHDGFRAGQRQVIETLVGGRSAAAVFPTGSGKSLCYQLPAMMLPGLTVVVSPLIALMKDQIDTLTRRRIAAARLDSSLSSDQQRQISQQLRAGQIKLLYVAPERFNNERFREQIATLDISLFAVDEAHCISEWGHNFRPDYLKLARYARWCNAGRILALTATAPPQVLEDICREFEIHPDDAVRTGFYRPNLHLRFSSVATTQRDALLVERLRERPRGATIVYVTLQKTATAVAQTLNKHDLAAKAYHAGLQTEQRNAIQEWFLSADQAIIVATIAFGMGIDKEDIRYVYHYNLPKSLENYSQEIGRAGRDGNAAICEVLANSDDLLTLENFAFGNTPSRAAVADFVRTVFGSTDRVTLSLAQQARELDLHEVVLRTLLTCLEIEDYIEGGTPIYNEYRFRLLSDTATILQRFDPARQDFLKRLFRCGRQGRTWRTIQADDASEQLHCERSRVVAALDYLAEKGWLELRAGGVQHPYVILRQPDNEDRFVDQLHQRMTDHEARELARLQQVVELIESTTCQSARLAAHFGEQRQQACGECTVCREAQPVRLPSRAQASIDASRRAQIETTRTTHGELARDPVSLARYLCGIRSPKLTRLHLTGEAEFGCLSEVPFDKLLAYLDTER